MYINFIIIIILTLIKKVLIILYTKNIIVKLKLYNKL